jgi:hypothetical protein
MRKTILFLTFSLLALISSGQFPFEKYPEIHYKNNNNWKVLDQGNCYLQTMLLPRFYNNGDSLSIQISSFNSWDSSFIKIYRNSQLIQTFFEPYSLATDYLLTADINGDSLVDLKLIAQQNWNGIAALSNRVVYLFQRKDFKFTKIAFSDMFLELPNDSLLRFDYRQERDFNGDYNYEIITMSLKRFENHNYWVFNLYNFIKGDLVCVNNKFDYPIMIQYLDKDNYRITNKISKMKMKEFSDDLPCKYDKK